MCAPAQKQKPDELLLKKVSTMYHRTHVRQGRGAQGTTRSRVDGGLLSASDISKELVALSDLTGKTDRCEREREREREQARTYCLLPTAYYLLTRPINM